MTHALIPFNRPNMGAAELARMAQAVGSGYLSGDGPFTKQCHAFLEQTLGVHRALLTTSCTDALELSALLLNLAPGDEVIVPSFTFVSTVNAFVLRGAKPVFCDVRADTLNLDEGQLERHVTARTKAIVVVHYAGVACEMHPILEIAGRHGIPVIEDNAHGLFGTYHGQQLGTFGCMATQSFHDTKNFTCGEGGALLINDPQYAARAEIVREKGTDRSRFLRGQVDKYGWVDVGSSFLPSDILAAALSVQLDARDEIQGKRQHLWTRYHDALATWGQQHGVTLPAVPAHCEQPYHMFYIMLHSLGHRQALIRHLRAHNIVPAFHYLPLHLSPMGRTFGGAEGDCPVTEQVSDRLLRLPFFNTMTDAELDRVASTIREFQQD